MKARKSLYRTSRNSIEENGANTLYLAIGFLKWYETKRSEKERYAPLVLWPVELVKKSSRNGYIMRVRDEEPQFNITLLEMLKTDYNINISGLDPLPSDDSGVDMLKVFTIVRRAIMDMKGWDISELAFIGIFSFNHFIMWNDIHNRAEELAKNKIVRSLISGKMEWTEESTLLSPKIIDEKYSPLDVAVPVSADSSQMSAICLSGQNSSFVLHGPPGTGKSQTITNMIANALYHGKTVLFIAEKMAALSVVQKRLDAIGLGPFCLELHSNKAKKKDVLSQLDASLNIGRIKAPDEYQRQAERLYDLRKKLNNIVEEIHKIRIFGFSLYDAISKTEQYIDYPCKLNFRDDDIASLTKDRFEKWCELAERLVLMDEECHGIYNNPLNGIYLEEYSMNVRDDANRTLKEMITLLKEYTQVVENCAVLTGCNIDSNESILTFVDLCEAIISAGRLPKVMVQNRNLVDYSNQVKHICIEGKERDRKRTALIADYGEQIVDYNYTADESAWREAETRFFIFRYFKKNRIFKRVKTFVKSSSFNKKDIPHLFEVMHSYDNSCNIVNNAKDFLDELFGSSYSGGNYSWDGLEKLYDSAVNINKYVNKMSDTDDTEVLDKLASLIEKSNIGPLDSFLKMNEKVNACKMKLNRLLGSDLSTLSLSLLSEKVKQWADNIADLRNWCLYNRLKASIISSGLSSLINYVENEKADDILAVFYRSIYQSCALWIISNEQGLSSFNGAMMRKDIAHYKDVCKKFEKLTQNELAARLSANIPDVRTGALASSETGILQKAIKSGGRMMSVRKLFDSIPNLLRRLAPCMLMSPISVAQYIDPSYPAFDLVIFDEASQMPTCEAVGAIARGKELIVVGDPKQLPPTSFFTSNRIDDDNIEQEDMESILDDCLALSMPQEHLLWHYRSRHESLIAFSNRKYYDNKLYTFPSPFDKLSRVSHVQVDGFYDRGKTKRNVAEAEAIIKEIERRLKDPELSKDSIGIVTFSVVQQNLISDMIDKLFADHPEYEEASKKTGEEIFVKNLENVQGDERDVILFSIGYGPDENGKLALNFGPLNREGGWRRLNVAVSRAKKEMIVFSVLRPEQIDVSRSRSNGVKSIKDFLEFAIYGTRTLTVNKVEHKKRKDLLASVIADKIKEKGYDVNTNIGCSEFKVDIGVIDPNNKDRYAAAVMLDGLHYASSGTSRDRNIVQEDVMHSLGWNIIRVMALDWFENPAKELERICKEIEVAIKSIPNGQSPKTNLVQDTVSFTYDNEYEDAKFNEYKPCKLETVHATAENFIHPRYNNTVRKQMESIIKAEAPISKTILKKRLLDAWGISRSGARISKYIDELLTSMHVLHITYGEKDFIYSGDPDSYKSFRVPGVGREKRSIEDISPEEISEAVKHVMSIQISINENDLEKEVARIFGFSRCTAIMKACISRGIKKAAERGYIACTDGNVTVL